MKPVCFASVALFSPGNGTCENCSLAAECHLGALRRIDALPDLPETRTARLRLAALGTALDGASAGRVQVSRRGIARKTLSEVEQARLQALPARARSMAKTLAGRGWFEEARRQLSRSINPGVPGTAMAVLCQLLLAGPVNRKQLVAHFVEQLDIKPASAQVEATTLTSVLAYGRIATLKSGVVERTPNLT